MSDLVERLKDASGPDRELDLVIAIHAFTKDQAAAQGWSHSLRQQRGGKSVCPEFTASIDSALTLVPDKDREFIHLTWTRCVLPDAIAHGHTPALAIVTAALLARDGAE